EASSMQRYGHHDVGHPEFRRTGHDFGQARGKPVPQGGHRMILEQADGADHRGIVRSVTAREIKVVDSPAAKAAERVWHLAGKRRDERAPAALTQWKGQ